MRIGVGLILDHFDVIDLLYLILHKLGVGFRAVKNWFRNSNWKCFHIIFMINFKLFPNIISMTLFLFYTFLHQLVKLFGDTIASHYQFPAFLLILMLPFNVNVAYSYPLEHKLKFMSCFEVYGLFWVGQLPGMEEGQFGYIGVVTELISK